MAKQLWINSPAGRRHIKRIVRLSAIVRRKKALANKRVKKSLVRPTARQLTQKVSDDSSLTFHSAYLLGKVEALIEFYASRQGISPAPLATQLAQLLRHSQGR